MSKDQMELKITGRKNL